MGKTRTNYYHAWALSDPEEGSELLRRRQGVCIFGVWWFSENGLKRYCQFLFSITIFLGCVSPTPLPSCQSMHSQWGWLDSMNDAILPLLLQ